MSKANGNGNGKSPKLIGENVASSDRKENGQFAKGWRGGPGRKRGAKTEFVIAAMNKALSPERAERIVEQYLTACEAGEAWALKDFLDRCLGKAQETIQLDHEITIADDPLGLLLDREVARALDRAHAKRVESNPLPLSGSARN